MEGAVRGTLSCVELRDVRRQVSTSLSAMSPFAGRFRVWMRRRARKLAQLAASARSPGGARTARIDGWVVLALAPPIVTWLSMSKGVDPLPARPQLSADSATGVNTEPRCRMA